MIEDVITINGLNFNKNLYEVETTDEDYNAVCIFDNEKLLTWLANNKINVNKFTFSFSKYSFNSSYFFNIVLPLLSGDIVEDHYREDICNQCSSILNTLTYYLSNYNTDVEVNILYSDINPEDYLLTLENRNIIKLFLNNYYISPIDNNIILVEFGIFNGDRL